MTTDHHPERRKLHELSIAQSIIEIVSEEARKNGLRQIRKIKLQVGEFAAIVPESLRFCLEMVSKDTIAEEAEVEIESVGIVARCDKCDCSFEVRDQVFICPHCDEPVLELVSGRELSVLSIEGETGEEDGADQCSCCS